jgi:hypothetical protein
MEHDPARQRYQLYRHQLMADTAPRHLEEDETMPDRLHCAAALILLLGATLPCAAQNTPAPQMLDPKACSDDQRLRAGRFAPQPPNPGNQTLSEKLEQTDGILCPPDIDPAIKVPTPDTGRMPVIPPPGGPGGDPTIRPK